MFFPMDSTRYFEFGTLGCWVDPGRVTRYLDVSSPRLFPLALLIQGRAASAELINPDSKDAGLTESLARAAGLGGRCHVHRCRIETAPFGPESFDLITSISVFEHIPRDQEAVRAAWRLLRPRGRLLLSLPCAAQPSEQYIDRNEYGLLAPDADGFVFWQRFYDERTLERNIFSVTGRPVRVAVYGEKQPGSFQTNAAWKRADPAYPFWREPLIMAREYGCFDRVADLPGEGVVAMEFAK
jgi:SAM-dependent methyltransferase